MVEENWRYRIRPRSIRCPNGSCSEAKLWDILGAFGVSGESAKFELAYCKQYCKRPLWTLHWSLLPIKNICCLLGSWSIWAANAARSNAIPPIFFYHCLLVENIERWTPWVLRVFVQNHFCHTDALTPKSLFAATFGSDNIFWRSFERNLPSTYERAYFD